MTSITADCYEKWLKVTLLGQENLFLNNRTSYLLQKWIMTKLNKLKLIWNRTDPNKQICSIIH